MSGTVLPQDGSHLTKHPPSSEGRQMWRQVLEDPKSCCQVPRDTLGLTKAEAAAGDPSSAPPHGQKAETWLHSVNLNFEQYIPFSFLLTFGKIPTKVSQPQLWQGTQKKQSSRCVLGGGIQRKAGRFGDANPRGAWLPRGGAATGGAAACLCLPRPPTPPFLPQPRGLRILSSPPPQS